MKKDKIEDVNLLDGMFIMDGYDDCIVGVTETFSGEPKVCYDKDMVLRKLMESGMDEFEALEFFEYNQISIGHFSFIKRLTK